MFLKFILGNISIIKEQRSVTLSSTLSSTECDTLAMRLRQTLPKLMPFQQTAYVKNRSIGEGGRLIPDILEMVESLNLKGYIITVDIEKAFDS